MLTPPVSSLSGPVLNSCHPALNTNSSALRRSQTAKRNALGVEEGSVVSRWWINSPRRRSNRKGKGCGWSALPAIEVMQGHCKRPQIRASLRAILAQERSYPRPYPPFKYRKVKCGASPHSNTHSPRSLAKPHSIIIETWGSISI